MLTEPQLTQFHRDGFLVVDEVLRESDLGPLEREYQQLVDDVAAELYQSGLISTDYRGMDFSDRYAALVSAYPDCIDYFNVSLPLVNGAVDPRHYRAHYGPAVFGLIRNDRILDVVESIIGPEISSSPVQQMRLKPPQNGLDGVSVAHSNVGITTWHQDTVAILPEALGTNQVTVWVAVTDADEENGCLVSIPGSHREGHHPHCPGPIPKEPTVPDRIIAGRKGTPLPVSRGGVVVFHRHNIHCSMPNRSGRLRWSVDLRYHPTGQANGRPAFPGFVARSQSSPESVLNDPREWAARWDLCREKIISGEYQGPIFNDWLQDTRTDAMP